MRLINADDLPISSIDMTDVGYHVSKYGQGIPAVYLDDIKDAPTIEPERKDGKWIRHGIKEGHLIEKYTCSECGFYFGTKTSNFCPDCGADMRGEQDE